MRRAFWSLLLPLALGCGAGNYEVVRVQAGRARVGRFVSPVAYEASLQAAIAEERGEWPRAVELLRRAREEDPDGPELGARLGVALCHVGKVQAGFFAIDDALRVDPELERGWTARARCRLLVAKTAADVATARSELQRALECDPEALEPLLLLVELDVRAGDLTRARLRAEEAVLLHPRSARALRMVADIAARQGDAKRAVSAALAAAALDDATGAIAKSAVSAAIDRSGVAAYGLALRGSAPALSEPNAKVGDAGDGRCAALLGAFERIAATAEAAEVRTAADGFRAQCPELDGTITTLEVTVTWTPKTAEEVEARALGATSAAARHFGARMRLRRMSIEELTDPTSLPAAEDRPTLAIHLASAAVRKVKNAPDEAQALASAARELAPSEPTVARLCGEVARRRGADVEHPWRKAACALARTTLEKQACGKD
ncbi:MAG: hypothetical protein HYV09_08950 [Deltaproteobacteria bacterium]|nr:hypothetical protein [Deltaproteobacteria bacterium]